MSTPVRAIASQRGLLASAVLVLAAAPLLSACESSQSKSARLERQAGAAAPAEQGLSISQPSKTLKATQVTTLVGEGGVAAVVVELSNEGREAAYEVPVLVRLTDRGGQELFTNATPGLQPSLTKAAFVAPGETAYWVNDQIPFSGGGEPAAEVTVGDPVGAAPTTPVQLSVGPIKLEEDPVSGVAAVGTVRHDQPTEQQRVLVTVVGRKEGRVVAAGRAIVERVKPGKRARFTAFLIGEPRGAELSASAGPSMEVGDALAPEATATPAS